MASFLYVTRNLAESLKNSDLIYVHCVAKDDYKIQMPNVLCLELVCREIHVSFIDNLAERRVALIPKSNGRFEVDSVFKNLDCPVLISIISSCDLKFTDLDDSREELFNGTLIWDYEIVPAPSTASVKPTNTVVHECNTIDQKLPLLNLEVKTKCNCFARGTKCLVTLETYREKCDDPLEDLLEDLEFDLEIDEEDSGVEKEESEETVDEEELYVECFKIVGSHWEQRYQDALSKCYELKVSQSRVEIRAEPEPNNIRDLNAIKFEVLCDREWHIMGYCGLKKIPKLKRARHNQEIVSLEVFNMKRKWVPQTKEFRFISGVNIVKIGRWDRDDPQNEYNYVISL